MANKLPTQLDTTTGKVKRFVDGTDAVGPTVGGTGVNTVTTGDVLYGSASNVWSKLAIGSTGQVAVVVAGNISWGVALIAGGGTGLSSYTAGDILYYASGTALSKLAIGASGYILTSTGTAPQWTSPATAGLTTFTNNSGATIEKLAPVYSSAAGEITKAQANSTTTAEMIGLATAAITNTSTGTVYTRDGDIITGTTGEWDAIAGTTGGLAFGVVYYLSTATAGRLQSTVPSTSGHVVYEVGVGVSTTQLRPIFNYVGVM